MQVHHYVFISVVGIPIVFNFFVLMICVCVAIGIYVVRDYVYVSRKEGNWWP